MGQISIGSFTIKCTAREEQLIFHAMSLSHRVVSIHFYNYVYIYLFSLCIKYHQNENSLYTKEKNDTYKNKFLFAREIYKTCGIIFRFLFSFGECIVDSTGTTRITCIIPQETRYENYIRRSNRRS